MKRAIVSLAIVVIVIVLISSNLTYGALLRPTMNICCWFVERRNLYNLFCSCRVLSGRSYGRRGSSCIGRCIAIRDAWSWHDVHVFQIQLASFVVLADKRIRWLFRIIWAVFLAEGRRGSGGSEQQNDTSIAASKETAPHQDGRRAKRSNTARLSILCTLRFNDGHPTEADSRISSRICDTCCT